MREADNKSLSIFLSVVGVYVVRTSSLNDKHSCQFSEKLPVLFFFLLLSVSTANLSCLLETTTSPRFKLLRVDSVVLYFLIFRSFPQSSAFLSSVLLSLFTLSFSFVSERFFFVHDKAALARSRNQ